ncbi:Hypothetical protein PBC10988_36530 [Planctomycetales bacterium 10988]|nr:Hypothetical protein PBC10988_36530 [Planctomycetales bacterium 10988]
MSENGDGNTNFPNPFEELRHEYVQVKRQFEQYKEESYVLAACILQALKQYLCVTDEETVSFYATEGHMQGRSFTGPAGAVVLGDDTFWHCGVVIRLWDDPYALPHENAAVALRFKKIDGNYVVQVEEDEQKVFPHEITLDYEEPDFAAVAPIIVDILKKRYHHALKDYLQNSDPGRRWGF